MLARSRALIVFADSCPDLPGGLSRQSSLNRVAEQGVTGWLTLRRPENGGRNGGVALAQLLGVMPEYISSAGGDVGKLTGFDKGASGSLGIKARYGGMDVRVVTNQTASMGLQSSLGVPCKLVETDFFGEEESARQSSEAVLTEVRALCEDSAEVIIVHLDSSAGGNGAQGSENEVSTRRCLDTLDQVMKEQCMDGSADILQLAMFGPLQVDRSTTSQASSAEAEWKRELLPRQSSTMHNGISLDDSCGEVASVTYAMFHPQASRCDQVRSLTAAEVASKGANGGTLAQHLMLEIAFLLGHMPKYGA